jgi:pyridoxal phosphate phosphatase PHOSPHO2
MTKYLAIFDFDHTVVDDNTDTCYWSLIPKEVQSPILKQFKNEELTWHQLLNKLMPLLPWNQLISTVETINLTPGMRELFNFLKESDSIICIVSDSNTEFIKRILNKQGLTDYVREVHTNGIELPSKTDPEAKVVTYEKAFGLSGKRECEHNCSVNHMCKGSVVEKLLEKYGQEHIPFFVGDGGNDYCAMKRVNRISEKGMNFVRKGFNLEKKIMNQEPTNREFVNLFWDDAAEITTYLKNESS